jgi:starch synthase
VVAADVGSVTEVVSDGVTGLVVPPEDPAAIAAAIAELRADPERRRSMAATARRVATERFTVEATVRDYCALFERILAT